jgi:hypothetical protein
MTDQWPPAGIQLRAQSGTWSRSHTQRFPYRKLQCVAAPNFDPSYYLEPFAADPIRRVLKRYQRILDREPVGAPAPSLGLLRNQDLGRKRPNRVLAMPSRHRAKLVENASLVCPPCRSIAVYHRRRDLAPRTHADPSCHRRHRSDSVSPPHSRRSVLR